MKTNIHFLNISCLVLLRMRTVSDYSCRENHNIYLSSVTFFFEKQAFMRQRNDLLDQLDATIVIY